MPVPTVVQVEVLVIVDAGAGLLVLQENTGGPGAPSHAFPGVPVGDGEQVTAALTRALERLPVPVRGEPEFAGCVERGTPGGPEPHLLTLLYAVEVAVTGNRTATQAGTQEEQRTHGPIGRAAFGPLGAEGYVFAIVDPAELATLPGVPADLATAIGRWWEDDWPVWRGLPVPVLDPRWAGLRQSVRTIRAQLVARRTALADVGFRDAAVAMCALVAAADGTISERERDAMVSMMASDEVLSQFNRVEITRLFDAHVAQLRNDAGTGRRAILRDIAKVRDRPVQARAVVRLGAVIGRADGVFDPSERAAVGDAARMLGIDASMLAVQAGASDPLETDTGDDGHHDGRTDDGRYQA